MGQGQSWSFPVSTATEIARSAWLESGRTSVLRKFRNARTRQCLPASTGIIWVISGGGRGNKASETRSLFERTEIRVDFPPSDSTRQLADPSVNKTFRSRKQSDAVGAQRRRVLSSYAITVRAPFETSLCTLHTLPELAERILSWGSLFPGRDVNAPRNPATPRV